MKVKIFQPGPKYYENFDKIKWNKEKEKEDDNVDSKDSVQGLRSDD